MADPHARLLIVDDSPVALAVLEAVFTAAHYEVVTAEDGQEAFDKALLGPPPDLILSDGVMPRVDGLALLRLLKANATTERIPVVMLTSGDFAAFPPGPGQPQPEAWVAKVRPMEELLEAVRGVLAASRLGVSDQ
jgi:CheY-like chemotaxis protein